jgi:hypothetical protein
MLHEFWVASHLVSTRKQSFETCVKYMLVQKLMPQAIYISISFESPELQKFVQDLKLPGIVHIFYQQDRLSQFEHLYFILKKVGTRRNVYISFNDDDDYSYPYRLQIVDRYISKNPTIEFSLRCKSTTSSDFSCFTAHQFCLEEFFRTQTYSLYSSVPPDLIFMESLNYISIDDVLVCRKNSMFDSIWNGLRPNGRPWYTIEIKPEIPSSIFQIISETHKPLNSSLN